MTKLLLSRLATFGAVAVLSGLLLMIFPYYPLDLVIVLALAAGAIALEFPNIALIAAILFSVLSAFYQNALVGLTFLVVFFIALLLTFRWIDMACVVASWILAFLSPMPWLAITPTLFAGLHRSRENAVEVGVASALSIFLLSWTMGISNAGLMLVPSPSSYVAKAIPTPWSFMQFIPNANMFTTTNLTNYYASLASSLGDFRVYALLASWAIAGFLTAFLASKLKGNAYYASSLLGVIPPAIVSFLFAQAPLSGIAAALTLSVILTPAYQYLEPIAERLNQVRKFAAIMFTDIVGYTAITQNDEALAIRILAAQKKVLRPIFEKYRGLEIKTIGDAFLVEFTNTLDAVDCAVEIQRTLQGQKLAGHDTQLHIGIHSGEVIHRANDVFGDVVNIAARIEPLAEPGEICISSQVREQILNKTDYHITPLGPKNLKNVRYPVEVYGVSPQASALARPTQARSVLETEPAIMLPASRQRVESRAQIAETEPVPPGQKLPRNPLEYGLFGTGLATLALSVIFSSNILVFIGLGLTLYGVLVESVPPKRYVTRDLMTAAWSSLKTVDDMIQGLGYNERVVYLPAGAEKAVAFIPAAPYSKLPSQSVITQGLTPNGKLHVQDPDGLLVAPPGLALADLIEKKLEFETRGAGLDRVLEALPKALVSLGIVSDANIKKEGDSVRSKLSNSAYADFCKQVHGNSSQGLGCPICSALGCILAAAAEKPLLFDEDKSAPNGKTTLTNYQFL